MLGRCPYCDFNVNIIDTGYCQNCNNELIVVNDGIYLRELYDMVLDLSESIDDTINNIYVSREEIENDFSNLGGFALLSPQDKEKQRNNVRSAIKSLIDFADSIYAFYEDPNQLQILKTMDPVFGDMEQKINKALSLTREHVALLTKYEKRLISEVDSNFTTEEEVAFYHNNIDDFLNNMMNINNQLEDILHNQKDLSELRNNLQLQNNFLNDIINMEKGLMDFKKILNNFLNNKESLDNIRKYDDKYGSIDDKINTSLTKIDEFLNKATKIKDFVNNTHNNTEDDDKEIPLNKGRVIDL